MKPWVTPRFPYLDTRALWERSGTESNMTEENITLLTQSTGFFFSSSIYMPVSSLFTEKWSNYRRMWVTVRIYTHWGFPWTGDTDLLTGAYTCAGVTLWLKYTQYLVVLNTQVSPEFLSRTFSSRFPSKAFSTLVWTLESVPRTELGLVIVAGLYLNTHVPS